MPNKFINHLGDSIALAVENVKFTLPRGNNMEKARIFTDLINNTLVYEPNSRASLPNIMSSLNQNFVFANEDNQVV
jgi:hypothetical protein